MHKTIASADGGRDVEFTREEKEQRQDDEKLALIRKQKKSDAEVAFHRKLDALGFTADEISLLL